LLLKRVDLAVLLFSTLRFPEFDFDELATYFASGLNKSGKCPLLSFFLQDEGLLTFQQTSC